MSQSNETLYFAHVAQEYGKLFYIIDPSTTSFPSISECPDYMQQALPYMTTLILLEAVINLWLGKPHNLADSVTSISSGLIMTMVGWITKGPMIAIYSWVYENYRIADLAWDSAITWILAALLVDLGYYWFHRASHEISLLWSVHQVHHSSEEFNLSTAFRQPVFQGLFQLTHWFYLPAALFIPPSHFLVHSHFVLLFQFWIHTELGGDLGPLGFFFNTSAFHQVHHGSNRYCLDKNYAGVLIIWDRMFGTFQDLRQDQELIYGLIDQPQFFDVIKHQLFYFSCIQGKVTDSASFLDKVLVWVKGPGWFPGLPRLGDNDLCPEIPQREKHYSKISTATHVYLVLQLLGVFLVHEELANLYQVSDPAVNIALMIFILWTLANIGFFYDGYSTALTSELSRCVVSLLYIQVLNKQGWTFTKMSFNMFNGWMLASLGLASLFSLVSYNDKKKIN